MDVIEATGEVVADASIWTYQTAVSLGSQFFHSFRVVLHGGSTGNQFTSSAMAAGIKIIVTNGGGRRQQRAAVYLAPNSSADQCRSHGI